MEAIVVFLVAVLALGVLVNRVGFDSRSGPPSPEQAYSQFGLTWGESGSELGGGSFSRSRSGAPYPLQIRDWLRGGLAASIKIRTKLRTAVAD
jgi:hypothetical protein